jgi:hypothetical protein
VSRVGGVSEPFVILLLSGSLREGSTNAAALRTAASVAPAGIETVAYDGMACLPHFNPDDDREGEPIAEAVAEMRAAVHSADALLICTPEYAGALPGSFKNLLEWTVGDGSTYEKRVAWINVSGSAAPTGGARRPRLPAQGSRLRPRPHHRGGVPAPACLARRSRRERADRGSGCARGDRRGAHDAREVIEAPLQLLEEALRGPFGIGFGQLGLIADRPGRRSTAPATARSSCPPA